jgi:DNA-directed RNA polymerase specialized sigma24 family protein
MANFEPVDRAPSPLACFEQLERESCLHTGMASLVTRDQIAIHLADFKGLSCSQAARAMTVSLAAFKSIHYRAMQRLGPAVRTAARTPDKRLPRAA